ncbi:MAG TPA: trypsin-like peptidase domain-containing protein [Polyangia bacterium]|nr:trypsin-like peptidase domain-containing protein [Polyangia bacterium]
MIRAAGAAVVLGMLAAPVRAEEPLWTDRPAGGKRATLTLAEISDRARPAVVHVRGTVMEPPHGAQPGQGVLSVGSGFFVSKAGYVVTNEHVVRGAVDLRVRLHDGREMAACVVGADGPTDIALLKVDARGAVPILPLADSEAVRVGETAVAIGSPFGFSHSVTAGIVSAKERVIDRGDTRDDPDATGGDAAYSFFIQTDASINVGNSGGPLVDGHGAVIGINAAFWGGGQAAQGVSFAIPINIAKLLLPRLRKDGEAPRSFLGVESQPITAALAEALHLPAPRGALIAGVLPGSAAEAAGIEAGDVVMAWEGRAVATAEDFKIYAQLTAPGTRARLKVLRDGKTSERVVAMRKGEDSGPPVPHPATCRALGAAAPVLPDGFEAADLPPARARGLVGGKGVEVIRVEGGAAREAGLLRGDVVLRVGRTPVRTLEELRKALKAASPAAPVLLLVLREGARFWTALPRH